MNNNYVHSRIGKIEPEMKKKFTLSIGKKSKTMNALLASKTRIKNFLKTFQRIWSEQKF